MMKIKEPVDIKTKFKRKKENGGHEEYVNRSISHRTNDSSSFDKTRTGIRHLYNNIQYRSLWGEVNVSNWESFLFDVFRTDCR